MLNETLKLASALPGIFVCQGVDEGGVSPLRMKSLGICEGRELELISRGDPMIVRVAGTQVGLSRQLACGVSVTTSPREVSRKAK